MKKISISPCNTFCPQTMFVYGTNNADGTPDFGLFCWVSYYWGDALGVMATICEDKRTRDNIRANGSFSMGLVTADMLPLADYFGCKSGYDADKMKINVALERGQILDVPVLQACPWTYELEVDQTFQNGNIDVYLCKIRNILAQESLFDEQLSFEEQLRRMNPVRSAGNTYFSWDGTALGRWGDMHSMFL